MSKGYIAATRGTAKAGGYAGVVTWSDWGTKKKFESYLASQDEQEVVEEGITQDRAIELCEAVPRAFHIEAALDDATDPSTNEIMPDYLSHRLRSLAEVRN